jgi:hypothetical protein
LKIFVAKKNGYSRSITLRNRLIPIGKTEENIQRLEILKMTSRKSRGVSFLATGSMV